MKYRRILMKIYETEILDGLEEALASSNTIAYCAQAEAYSPSESEQKIQVAKALDAGNQDQMDLFYLRSILVSTGWNRNDDVFDPQELWNARTTPEDKPFNYMHDEKDIIGHITGNALVDFEGNEIDENTAEIPSDFNILTTSVIYTAWSDIEQKERMEKIVAEIEQGKWYVSMECLFPEFDYALTGPDGESRVVKRAEASSFLTKHLRAYGGTGQYQNYKVGRLLRNLAFSGKGLVSKPANPRSIILDGTEPFSESRASALDVSLIKENDMSDVLNQQIADLQKDLAEAKAANDSLQSELDSAKSAELEASVADLTEKLAAAEAQVVELTEAMKCGEEKMKKMEEEVEAGKKYMAEMEEDYKAMKKKEAMMKRKASLLEIGISEEAAASTVEDFADVDDATFDRVVATLQKAVPVAVAEEAPAEEVEEVVAAEEEVKLDEEVDSSEASEADLDAVEEPEAAIAEVVVEDEVESLRAVASEWLGSVLKSSK
jgi:hypothetical protein